jgi:hypothetical protein
MGNVTLNQPNDFNKQQEIFFGKKNRQGGQIVTNAASKPLKEFEEDEFADF